MSDGRLAPNVFAELLRPHLPALYRLAFRFTGRQFEAEDLVQELLTRLYARSVRLTAVESLRPWLARALYNLHVDQRRHLSRTPHGHLQHPAHDADDAEPFPAQQDPSAHPDFSTEMDLLKQGLAEAVAELPEEQRAVIILHDVEGYELHETAAILGIALGTVKSRLHRAHGRLRERLQQRNLIPSNVVSREESPGEETATSNFGVIDHEL
jgi:RNA polymerase sigma-70 factor (ECF subfamily)